LFKQSVDVAVKKTWAGVKFVLGTGEDFALEGVAVTFTLEEGKKEMECERGQVF
jgi:hypothetical protein